MSLQMVGSIIMHGHPAGILDYARDFVQDYARPVLGGLEPDEPGDGRL